MRRSKKKQRASSLPSLECGFVSLPNGQIFPLDSCSLQLANHGEAGTSPKDYGFLIEAGGLTYEIQTQIVTEAEHFYGGEDECKIVERMAKYRVNGIGGAGITEWQYRNNHCIAARVQ